MGRNHPDTCDGRLRLIKNPCAFECRQGAQIKGLASLLPTWMTPDVERLDLYEARRAFATAKRSFNRASRNAESREGLKLLKRAAALGHIGAHAWLGVLYDYGLGVRPNRRRALEHYMVAAQAGDADGEYHVGVFYHDGIAVPKNYKVA